MTPPEETPPKAGTTGVRARRRTLLVTAGVAVVALAAGLFAGTQIQSAADAARQAQPPEASAITVPVELRELETVVRTRGDAGFAGSTEVELELGGLATAPVVTGQVPEAGDELVEGEPLLEVVGRPVIALQGELPMYRSLRPGMSGPDVEQLKETLRRLGFSPGADDDRYTAATAQAVGQLFTQAGYPPPEPDEEAAAELAAAQEAVTGAEEELAAAKAELQDAEPGSPELAEAKARVKRAESDLASARQTRSEAQVAAGTPLPDSEVFYLPSLPRRVDEVMVGRGDLAEGAVMAVSGADLLVTTLPIGAADREVLAEGMAVTMDWPGGESELTGTITEIRPAGGDDPDRYLVDITPDDPSPAEVDALREAGNVRVTIPVSSTGGEVLAVPLAALTAGPGGEARVEVQRDDGTELVVVEVGLRAEGYAEVTPQDGSLAAGDLVVVGESGAEAPPTEPAGDR